LVSFQMQLYQIRRKTSPWHLHDMWNTWNIAPAWDARE
jgi:hypothetical protein